MTEVEMDSLRSESNPCNTDENYYLEECVKKAITYYASNLTCATPGNRNMMINQVSKKYKLRNFTGIRRLFDSSKLPECQNSSSAEIVLSFLHDILIRFNSNFLDCEIPCKQTWFDLDVASFLKNSILTMSEPLISDNVMVIVYYKTLNTEVRTETLLYDAGSFFAAAGGHLGLTLGFSCFSTILYFINKCSIFKQK